MYRLFSHVKMALTWRPPPELVSSERDRERNAIPVVILRDMMKAKVVREGSSIVSDPELLKEPSRVIASLLDLRDKYVAIVERAFCGDRIFATGLKEAFEMIVNRGDDGRGSNGVPEFLATYVDEAMTRDFKTLTEMEVSERLDKVVHLFRFLHSKDVFEEHYKDKTARRLLGGKITSEDTERLMISKLKQECGSNYTNKLEGMFADLHRSATFMEQFRRDQGAAVAALGLELDATVLTSSNWVGRQLQSVPMPKGLPPSVEAAAGIFHKYYLSKHNGRRLVWNCSKGTVEIRARFGAALTTAGAKPYELTVSTYQMIVLMALNDRPSLPYRDLAALCIPEDELKRHLLSLTNAKIRILNKSTAVRKRRALARPRPLAAAMHARPLPPSSRSPRTSPMPTCSPSTTPSLPSSCASKCRWYPCARRRRRHVQAQVEAARLAAPVRGPALAPPLAKRAVRWQRRWRRAASSCWSR